MCSKTFFSKATEPIDQWLEAQGLYRKHTAHDPSCLFRAVAEQVYFSQCCHDIVRKQCVNFIAENKALYEKRVEGSLEEYLSKLSNPKEWGSQLELNAMSLLYQREVIVFEQREKPIRVSINNIFKQSIMLCYFSDNHYDSVYTKPYIMKAAFCQSLVYEILYERVFCLQHVDFAVAKMLHKSSHSKREHYMQQNFICSQRSLGLPIELPMKRISPMESEEFEDELNVKELLSRGIIPFPYKVAKALDPDIYRNIELDVWSDLRKVMKLGVMGGSDDELQVGVKCLVKMQPDRVFHAHIQEMEPNNGPVIVFVEELGKKCTVSHDTLEPLPKSQKVQWAVPYKHQITTLPSKSPYLNLSELSNKWKKNKYNKSRKLKDLVMPTPIQATELCPSNGHCSSLQQDSSTGRLHYLTDHFNCNQSNVSLSSSEDCSNESCQVMQTDNTVNSGVAQLADSSSSASPPLVETDQNYSNSCSSPLQIVGVPLYHSFCPEAPGMRVSTPSASSPVPSYIFCNGNPQGQNPVAVNLDNYTLQPVNFYAQKSVNLNGSDLPFSDIPTLRFYYNLGHDYFRSGYMMWSTAQAPCQTPAPSLNTADSNQHSVPDSTTVLEDDTFHGQKTPIVQTVPIVPQQSQLVPHVIPQTITHSSAMSTQVVPQLTPTSGVATNMLPPAPLSTTLHQTVPHSQHKLVQHSCPSPPQHAVYPVVPQSPPVQPMFAVNNVWTHSSPVVSPQPRVNVPDTESRSSVHATSEDCCLQGNDSKNACLTNIAVHSPVMDSYSQTPVYPYYVVEMDSVQYYNPCSYVMQPSEMDVMGSSQTHTVPASTVPTMSPVLYHPQNMPPCASMQHWIPSEVPQYSVTM